MKYLFYSVIVLAMTMQLSQAMEDGNELTSGEEAAVGVVMKKYNIRALELDDESVLLTQQMANEFPLSALRKMLSANETAIAQPQEYPPNEIERLSLEADIFRQAIANYAQ